MNRREFLRCAAGIGCVALAGAFGRSALRVSDGRRAAERFLASRQSPDGAWRSAQYGAFRDGDVLTPVVLWAMAATRAGESPCIAAGRAWLERLTDTQTAQPEPWTGLAYPLFTAAYAARFFRAVGDTTRTAAWANVVEALRIRSEFGWPGGDPACGAWGDSASPPRLSANTPAPPDMLAPNLSATLLGVQALVSAGRRDEAAAALPFIRQCQNFASKDANTFDDGGFFFAPGDPIRNKAGIAGHDDLGYVRFRSYGSATCDGWLALRACGLAADHPRVAAATRWLRNHTAGASDDGTWPADRAAARESLVFYHSQAFAEVLAGSPGAAWVLRERDALTRDLLARQQPDGSWRGEAPASCEDDPLLATAFALRSL